MSRLRIFDDHAPGAPLLATSDRSAMTAELAKIDVHLEQWTPAHAVQPGDAPEAIMAAYKADIDRLVEANG
ncbi:MAG: acireductone dioxygenase, partial [Thermomonas sp.]